VANILKESKDFLKRSLKDPQLLSSVSTENIWLIESIINNLDRITQRIDKAISGYAGFFDAIKVLEDKLDLVIKHDQALLGMAENLKEKIKELMNIKIFSEEWRNKANEILQYINEIDDIINKRVEILRGLIENA